MSRGLGPQQKRAVAILRTARQGVTVADLVAALGVTVRRAQKIAASLIVRDIGHPTYDDGRLRVWSRHWLEREQFERGYTEQMLRRTGPFRCPKCHEMIEPTPEEAK